jgi:hypothetical protein
MMVISLIAPQGGGATGFARGVAGVGIKASKVATPQHYLYV